MVQKRTIGFFGTALLVAAVSIPACGESTPSPAGAQEGMHQYALKNADAVNATKLINAIFQPDEANPLDPTEKKGQGQALHGKVKATANKRTNTIDVTATAETLKVVEKILQEVDAGPGSASAIRVFALKHTDAEAAVTAIKAKFKPKSALPQDPNAPTKPADVARFDAHVIAAAEARTNSVIIAAPNETLVAIVELIKRLDSDPKAIQR